MENTGVKRFQDYISQHIEILEFLGKNHDSLLKIMATDANDGLIIVEFMNKFGECLPYIDKYGEALGKTGDILSIMEPAETMHMFGALAKLFDVSDAVMGIYLKHTAKGGNNE